MRPYPQRALLALGLTGVFSLGTPLSAGRGPERRPVPAHPAVGANGALALDPAGCGPGTLPEGDACVRFPSDDDPTGAPESETSVNSHRDLSGRWVVYDEIPRRPDRPEAYEAYRYPVPCASRPCVASGYDLDRADDEQRRGRRLRHVGHGAVDLLEPRGTPVVALTLEHQEGAAEVVHVGLLFGNTVVTRHTVREGGRLRDYLLIFGHLDAVSPDLHPGASVREGEVLGFVGDSGSPGIVHLHLEVRRVRDGVDMGRLTAGLSAGALVEGTTSVVCDPRNVLPLR